MRLGHVLIAVGVLVPLLVVGGAGVAADGPDASRDLLVGVQGPMDRGQVVRYNGTDPAWRVSAADSYHGVVRDGGRIVAAFANDSNAGSRTGYHVIDPSGPRIADKWSYSVRTMGNSEVHDLEPLPSGGAVVVGMDRERVFTLDGSGSITWQWNASAYYDAPPFPRSTDWLHMNDVDRIGDGRYLVSVRNENQLLVLERGEGVVDVINEDGDPSVMLGQHNPQWLGEGRVLVADSSNGRVVELAKRGGEWKVVWSVDSAKGQPFAWPRDADRLPSGNTLITDSRNNRVVLVDGAGDTISWWRTAPLPYEADLVGVGEPVGGPYQTNDVDAPADGEEYLPFMGKLWVGLAHGIGLPGWFRQWHLAVAVGGAVVVLWGGFTLVVEAAIDRFWLEPDGG